MDDPIRLAIVPLADAAPLVYAQETGLFVRHGVEVHITVEPSWANIADKLAWGLLDGAVLLQPLAIAMALGLRGPATKLVIPAGISLNGNAITLARPLAKPMLHAGMAGPSEMAARLRALPGPRPLRLAAVHAFSSHDLLLRHFLESGGIDPHSEAEWLVIPPPDMPAALGSGRIDGFCAGAPWSAVAAENGVGRTVALGSAIFPFHPEKCLAVRQDWAEARPQALRGLLRALRSAARACDDPSLTPELAALLARPEWVGVPARLIAASLPGGRGGHVDRSVFASHGAAAPSPDRGAWLYWQMARWRTMPSGGEAVVRGLYRPDLYADALGCAHTPVTIVLNP